MAVGHDRAVTPTRPDKRYSRKRKTWNDTYRCRGHCGMKNDSAAGQNAQSVLQFIWMLDMPRIPEGV